MTEPSPAEPANSEPASTPQGGRASSRTRAVGRLAAWFLGSLLLGLLASFAWERWVETDRLPRSVSLAEMDLSRQPRGEARRRLLELRTRLSRRHVELSTPSGRLISLSGEQLGLLVDVESTLYALESTGRTWGGLLDFPEWMVSLVRVRRVAPIWTLEQQRLERSVGKALEAELRAPLLPSLSFDAELRAERGGGGTVLDGPQLSSRVLAAAPALLVPATRARVLVPLTEQRQSISDAEFSSARGRAERLLAGPLRFVVESSGEKDEGNSGNRPGLVAGESSLSPERFGRALRSEIQKRSGAQRLALTLDAAVLRRVLGDLLEENEIQPKSASFEPLASGKVRLVPSIAGRRLDEERLEERIWEASEPGSERTVVLPWKEAEPDLTTERASALGIKRVVRSFSTQHACCRPRVDNIHTAAARIDGVVVLPGERFSLNDRLGPRTKAAGYRAAPTIVHGQMEKVLGGGISQLATTLFNAVLRGGYAIVQRQPHSIYFPRYPEGHEATVSYPEPDLVFENDTKSGLVLRTQATPTMIRVLVLGDDEGRRVSVHKSRRTDIVEPPIEYEADDSMDPEKSKRLRAGQLGWKVVVSRVVTYADGEKKEEKRQVTYQPRPELVRVHPCKIPEGEDGHTGEDCPEPEREEREEVLSEDTYYETVDWEMDEGG